MSARPQLRPIFPVVFPRRMLLARSTLKASSTATSTATSAATSAATSTAIITATAASSSAATADRVAIRVADAIADAAAATASSFWRAVAALLGVTPRVGGFVYAVVRRLLARLLAPSTSTSKATFKTTPTFKATFKITPTFKWQTALALSHETLQQQISALAAQVVQQQRVAAGAEAEAAASATTTTTTTTFVVPTTASSQVLPQALPQSLACPQAPVAAAEDDRVERLLAENAALARQLQQLTTLVRDMTATTEQLEAQNRALDDEVDETAELLHEMSAHVECLEAHQLALVTHLAVVSRTFSHDISAVKRRRVLDRIAFEKERQELAEDMYKWQQQALELARNEKTAAAAVEATAAWEAAELRRTIKQLQTQVRALEGELSACYRDGATNIRAHSADDAQVDEDAHAFEDVLDSSSAAAATATATVTAFTSVSVSVSETADADADADTDADTDTSTDAPALVEHDGQRATAEVATARSALASVSASASASAADADADAYTSTDAPALVEHDGQRATAEVVTARSALASVSASASASALTAEHEALRLHARSLESQVAEYASTKDAVASAHATAIQRWRNEVRELRAELHAAQQQAAAATAASVCVGEGDKERSAAEVREDVTAEADAEAEAATVSMAELLETSIDYSKTLEAQLAEQQAAMEARERTAANEIRRLRAVVRELQCGIQQSPSPMGAPMSTLQTSVDTIAVGGLEA